jgi:hypothetical protein
VRTLTLIVLLVCHAAASTISGTVRDPDGKPVAGAIVHIDGAPALKTGEGGEFSYTVNAAGPHVVVAESPAFTAVEERVMVAGADLKVDLAFTRLASHSDSVTVVADASTGDVLNRDPSQNTILRDESLDANPSRPGAPVSIPGVPVETASGGIKAPQYFAPGVAGDHGETIAQFLQVGTYLAPNNLSANAHGNGYADPNLIVPAIIESVQTDAGAFNVLEGNHAVNFAATYGLRSRLQPFLTLAADPHDADATGGWNPFGPSVHGWIVLEAAYGNGLLRALEHRRQYKLNAYREFDIARHRLTILTIGYFGSSRLPGLVPIDAAGSIDTIDSRQRDQTHTAELIANDVWHVGSGTDLHFSGFYRTYNLALISNFGDGLIRQSEFRTATGGQANYVKKAGEYFTFLAGVDYAREAPRRLDLDRYDADSTAFQKVTANNVTINMISPYLSLDGHATSWLRFNLGWRRDQIGFDNSDLMNAGNSFHRWAGVDSPKATVNLLAPESLPLPSVSFSFGQAFVTNDPRIGASDSRGTLVSRAHSYQTVLSKTVAGTDFRLTLGRVTQEQSLAKIDPDTGLQYNEGPSRNRYMTFSARRRFSIGMIQASVSKADARDLTDGTPIPEAPRRIIDLIGTIDRLPFHLRARGEFEEVGSKPLGDGFVARPVREIRGAVLRPFLNGRLDAGVQFLVAKGFTGQTTETLAFERIVGVRMRSYASVTVTYHF